MKAIKVIRILLLVLILIGVTLLLTQSLWVPKLVNHILLSEQAPAIISGTQPNITLKNGRQCYTYDHEATREAPYTVNEFIDITIKGNMVTGTKTGTQRGPDMTNGYSGTISGMLNNNTITDVYSYVVEGAHNKEEEIYKAGKTGIEKLRYPLLEKSGILVPDTTKEFQTLLHARVGCTASN